MAAAEALVMLNGFAITVKPSDTEKLKKIAETALTGKNAEVSKDRLCNIIVKAITFVTDPDGKVDIAHINVEKKVGDLWTTPILSKVWLSTRNVHIQACPNR